MLEKVGNCRVVEEVAAGGMAVVYRAIQDSLGRTVAIKALRSDIGDQQQLVTRFEREAQSLALLQHENIISVYDFFEQDGERFIVMEFVEGIDLYDLLDICGRVPYDVAAVIAMQVARALDYIHYRTIVHRDIKPANIMVSRQGGVKVMDFGIARDKSYERDLTQTGTGIGTPSYMSPEQILGDKLDARSDIFSLGIVLYQMLTGGKPFVEDEEKSVMHKIRLEKHVKCRKLNPEIPRELERIVDKCLEKEPRRRFRSAQQLVMSLERFLSKHVEMNYHARLVLFLKNQDIITQLEADEYLNPALGGPSASALSQPQQAMRRVWQRSLVVQGAILGVVAIMVGLIHLAPVGATPSVGETAPEVGYVQVIINPWGRAKIGEVEVTTPLAEPVEVPIGSYAVTIENEYFETKTATLEVPAGTEKDPVELRVDLERVGKRLGSADDDEIEIDDDGPGPRGQQ
ncbi:MAG: serine/threonine protein kinase [Deltaproteobacteria bacterium]|nr:serine/threonine protein kinase [Deltaproteobacteria bacterium]